MHGTTYRLALANLGFPSTPEVSVTRVLDAIEEAGARKADIICFPECYVPGYRTADRPMAPPDASFLERAWARVADAARRANTGVVLGTERVDDGKALITALVVSREGRVLGFQDKVQLDPSEDSIFVPGSSRRVFTDGGLTFGVAICHEGWRYPETVRFAARNGAQVVFLPHYSWHEDGAVRPTTYAQPDNSFHEKALLCRAAENTCFVAGVNYATDGSPTTSAVAQPDGTVLAWHPYGEDGVLVVDIDTATATRLLALRHRPVPGTSS